MTLREIEQATWKELNRRTKVMELLLAEWRVWELRRSLLGPQPFTISFRVPTRPPLSSILDIPHRH